MWKINFAEAGARGRVQFSNIYITAKNRLKNLFAIFVSLMPFLHARNLPSECSVRSCAKCRVESVKKFPHT